MEFLDMARSYPYLAAYDDDTNRYDRTAAYAKTRRVTSRTPALGATNGNEEWEHEVANLPCSVVTRTGLGGGRARRRRRHTAQSQALRCRLPGVDSEVRIQARIQAILIRVPEEWLTGASVVNVWLVMALTPEVLEGVRGPTSIERPRSGYFDGTSDVPHGPEFGAPGSQPKSPCPSAEVLTMSCQTQSVPFSRRLENNPWSSRAQCRGVRDAD
ncbi:hypothetical protein BDP55DRAFT_630398 [Colletotrichum godetiae]|uniref:Uncharacterized protein n=1 Tax=Colletotrichum godetiae TaxID=1209918 RepID=A0AAJ0AQA0_9PEZI|nr:uncharacterized protein BDP55DRAFT_630398 [Colletotrichum godetiae]KAK1687758.1 hypothetical protein BDP55DRAFT_630398 [Colletotrichum godetiae]